MFLLHNIIFAAPQNTRLNSKHYFMMKILENERELQQVALTFKLTFKTLLIFTKKLLKSYILF